MNTFILVLIFVGIPVVLFIGIILWIKSNKQSMYETGKLLMDEYEERFEKAIVADAVVKNIQDSKVMSDSRGKVKMDLLLEVYLRGKGYYETTASWIVDASAISQVQPGENIQVKVDANDDNKVYPSVNWAAYWLYS
ncbi:MAG: hypothetical protein EHM58_12790 [Ignavibacteriae bacterium]|nr:MAG: hypothetical protein EHM58_12790 [Ignavibacteriota bacterium]